MSGLRTKASLAGLLILACAHGVGSAQESPATLAERQKLIESQYQNFETVVQRMADLLRQEDPDRAALMLKVFAQSKKDLIAAQMSQVKEQLAEDKFNDAAQLQERIIQDMAALLDLMLSENRAQQIRQRRERAERQLKQLQELKSRQRTLRLQTEQSGDDEAEELSDRQAKLAEETDRLRSEIEDPEKDAKKDKAEGESEGQEEKSADAEGQPPTPKDVRPSDRDAPPEETLRTENLKNASRSMQQAQRELKQLKRRRAAEKQDEALRELDQAIEQIEELLRQLREEERLQRLATLEERFRKMYDLQQIVYEGTVRLNRIPEDRRSRVDRQQILALSRQENELVAQAEQALLLLQDDGSALAFPEAVLQLREDMSLIASLLAKEDVGDLTQQLEAAVLEALEEMVLTLQREQDESKRRAQGDPQQQGQTQRQPLVQKIAELKMIRNLQQRVNERAALLSKQAGEAPILGGELEDAVRKLAQRQAKLYEITRDVARQGRQ